MNVLGRNSNLWRFKNIPKSI